MTGLLIGTMFGVGVLILARGWRAGSPTPPLLAAMSRVPAFAPFSGERDRPITAALRPALDLVARLLGGRRSVERRLLLAGSGTSVEAHLLTQVMWSGAFAAVALLLVVASDSEARPGPSLVVLAVGVVGGPLFGDYLLSRRIASRRDLISEQFPVAAQLLALLVAAGAPPSEAVGRVGRAIGGPLGDQLSTAAQRTAQVMGSRRRCANSPPHPISR